MIEQRIFEYLVNSLWQLPLLVVAAWLVIRIARPGLVIQHSLWLAALALAVVLPLRGIGSEDPAAFAPSAAMLDAAAPLMEQPAQLSQPHVLPDVRTFAALRLRSIQLEPRTVDWLIGIYGVSIAFGLARLVHGWLATKRLVAEAAAHPLTLLESALLRVCAGRIELAEDRLPEVRFLGDEVAGPMVAGVRRPALLLPECLRQSSDAGFDDHALTAVLLHELMHVRRRDYLANLLARVVALPIVYHPATHVLHGRIRQTREMICDAAAAGAFPSKSTYARSLLALAEGIVTEPYNVEAVGLFDSTRNLLEERIMKLIESKLPVSPRLRSARVVAGTLVLVAGTGGAATLHLKASTPVVYAMQSAQAPPAAAPAPEPQVATPAPAAAPAPAPAPAARPRRTPEGSADRQEVRDLTPQERKEIDEQAAAVHEQMEHLKIEIKNLKPIVIPKIDLKILNSPEFEKQMADLKVAVDSPEFRKQMEELKIKVNSPEFKKEIAEASEKARVEVLNSADFKRQMEDVTRQVNSPEFKRQIEMSKKLAIDFQADAGRRREEMRKQLAEAAAAIAEARKQVHDSGVEKELDEAQKRIEEATRPF